MKKLLSLYASFVVILVIAEILVSIPLLARAVLNGGFSIIASYLPAISAGALPAATIFATFVSFFTLDRLFSSRLKGYAALAPLTLASFAGAALAERFLGPWAPLPPGILPAAYAPVVEWLADAARAPWPLLAAGVLSLTALVCSFWPTTRLSRSRPLVGAFLAPSAALAAVYLAGAFRSEPAEALFSLMGFPSGSAWHAPALAAIAALALGLVDALVARKPAGGASNA